MVLTDAQWAALEPLVEECRPKGKTRPSNLRRTLEAILWRCRNGATWRAIPKELGPWWMAAQTFIRWSKLGVWERLLERTQAKGVELGLVFLDGTTIRAHAKAAGARGASDQTQKGDDREDVERVKRLADLAAAMGRRPASSPTPRGAPSPS